MPKPITLSPSDARRIEGYAEALADIIAALTGDSPCGKSYDPMTIDGDTMHSYAFDMRDGGRHHPVSDYESVSDIKAVLLQEAVERIREDLDDEKGEAA